ncbi:MAG: hypothetical protein AABX54_04530 [Nanoarchaeota archaeon]
MEKTLHDDGLEQLALTLAGKICEDMTVSELQEKYKFSYDALQRNLNQLVREERLNPKNASDFLQRVSREPPQDRETLTKSLGYFGLAFTYLAGGIQ